MRAGDGYLARESSVIGDDNAVATKYQTMPTLPGRTQRVTAGDLRRTDGDTENEDVFPLTRTSLGIFSLWLLDFLKDYKCRLISYLMKSIVLMPLEKRLNALRTLSLIQEKGLSFVLSMR